MNPTRPPRILLIEDDEATARALRVLFHQRAGLDVAWAANLAEGRAHLDDRPDAILLDLMLPDGEGESLLREIAERTDSPRPRVVICTALPEGSPRIEKLARLGPDAVIHKPYEIEGLMAAVAGGGPVPEPLPPPTPKGTP